ncbi:hypothetical protein PMZ80_003668 [Knufia obscura]|uniref:Heterokaryon incompatibility domain-containing protein n=1 Tax=Knufia obscura TaxID=1635080 RepID=A0ABR0RUV5_9EURO|nr:hypothetical protein PMZ80_003668 [Knufia obscura]
MSNSRQYQYDTLPQNHFRLLTLLPGTREDRIKIRVESYDISSPPSFTALSYCWGSGSKDSSCDCEPSQLVFITKNLDQALRHCRSEKTEAHVWIDQICIDQDNDDDKTQQVRLMRAIYSSAANVIIWLGDANEKTKLVYDLIEQIGQEILRTIRSNPKMSFHDPADPMKIYVPLKLSSADEPEWFAFRQLLSRPWFERTWTFQELVLAKEAYLWCGPHKTSWNQFFMVCMTIDTWDRKQKDSASHLKGETEKINFLSTCAARHLKKAKQLDFDAATSPWAELGTLMKNAMKLKSSIGHDKIYALLGVAEDVHAHHFPIRYTAPLREVYANVTKHLIAGHGDLSPLGLKSVVPEVKPRIGPSSFPSWVPDYRYARSEFENRVLFVGPKPLPHGRERGYSATGLSRADVVVDWDLKLRLRGVFVGRIEVLSELSGNLTGLQSNGRNVLTNGSWQQLAQQYASDSKYVVTNEPIDLAYARTRVCDYLPGETRPQHRAARAQPLSSMSEPGPSSLITTPNGEKLFDPQINDAMPGRILASTTGRRLCISADGHICLCHQNCVEGDEIWLLLGADMPFILRKLETGMYHFMGEAYVHGVMDGEHLIRQYKHLTQAGINLSNNEWLDKLADDIEFTTQEVVLV